MRFKSAVTSVAYSPAQPKRLLAASKGGTVCVLDTASFRVLHRFGSVHPGGALSVAFGPPPAPAGTTPSKQQRQRPVRFYSCGADGTAVQYSMDPT